MFRTRAAKSRVLMAAVLTCEILRTSAVQASPYSDINAAAAANPITVSKLRGQIRMLSGSGGNIGVLWSPNGIFMIDAGIAVSKDKIQTVLRRFGSGPVRYVVNTHWHWDHTDGNAWLRAAGATVLADPHVVRRLSETIRVEEWEHTFTPIPAASLPNRLVPGDETIRFGGEIIKLRHYMPSHTDGDLSAYFVNADVLQTGDTFWNGAYPFIDYVGGGSINGAIRAAEANLKMAGPRTMIIPGHGPVGNRQQLVAFRDMLTTIRARVAALKARGFTIDQAVAARPTRSFDQQWGRSVISGALFTRLVYRGV